MTIDTDELRRLAEAARDSNRDEPGELPYDLTLTPEDQELILALSPTTILALLDRLATVEQLEARIGALEACIRPLGVLRQHIMLRNQLMAVGFCDVCRRPERDGHAVDCAWGAVEAALAALRQPPAATGGQPAGN